LGSSWEREAERREWRRRLSYGIIFAIYKDRRYKALAGLLRRIRVKTVLDIEATSSEDYSRDRVSDGSSVRKNRPR
jgi:hypothetical protein